jgi:hypothetical protein
MPLRASANAPGPICRNGRRAVEGRSAPAARTASERRWRNCLQMNARHETSKRSALSLRWVTGHARGQSRCGWSQAERPVMPSRAISVQRFPCASRKSVSRSLGIIADARGTATRLVSTLIAALDGGDGIGHATESRSHQRPRRRPISAQRHARRRPPRSRLPPVGPAMSQPPRLAPTRAIMPSSSRR